MERESNPMPMCRSGCGFYGNPAQDGLCSVCYKDSLRKKQQPPVSSTPVSVPSPQQTQSFNSSVTVTNTAQPTVQSLQINEKDVNEKIHVTMTPNKKSQKSDKIENESAESKMPQTINSGHAVPPDKHTSELKPNFTATKRSNSNNANTVESNKSVNRKKTKLTPNPIRDIEKTIPSQKFLAEDCSTTENAGPSISDDNDDKDGDKDSKKKKNRCAVCRKKVGLTGFECRCAGLFCAVHRYSDKHDCTFDYREHGAQEIRRNNPVVVGEKIQKI